MAEGSLQRGTREGSAPGLLRRGRSALGRVAREAALYPAVLRPGRGPRLAVLPSEGRAGSSLLRGYNIAEALRARGWSALCLPPHLRAAQRARVLGLLRPDIVLVQQAWHELNRVQHLTRWRLVLDIDDADFLDPRLEPALVALASRARGVSCGSRFIRDWAARYNANARVIWTGTPVSRGPWPTHEGRRPLVVWAQQNPHRYPRELEFVAGVMSEVAQRRGGAALRLHSWSGPRDVAPLRRLEEAGVTLEFLPRMPYAEFVASLREAAVGLSAISADAAFSQGKSFGKVLAYLDAKVPVVCSDAADHALFFEPETGVVSNDPAVWADAVTTLLEDPARRTAMADAAHRRFRDRLSVDAAADRLHDFLTPLLGAPTARPAPEHAHRAH